jgi:hypothetical protein
MAGSQALVPVEIIAPTLDTDTLMEAVALGAAGVVSPPTRLQSVKVSLRELDTLSVRMAIIESGYKTGISEAD